MFDVPPGKALKIRKWNDRHENHESRRITGKLPWIRVPTTQNSLGLLWLLDQKRGAECFGIYILLAELSANCSPRGTLARNGRPLSLSAISSAIRIDKRPLRNALEMMMSPDCRWFELVDCAKLPHDPITAGRDAKNQNQNKNNTPLPPSPHTIDRDAVLSALGITGVGRGKILESKATTPQIIRAAISAQRDPDVRSWRAVLPRRAENEKAGALRPQEFFTFLQLIADGDQLPQIGGLQLPTIDQIGYNSEGIIVDGRAVFDARQIKSL